MKPKHKYRILIGCEFSGVVRNAFIKQGFTNTHSCDILPTSSPGNHIQGDIVETAYNHPWDLAIFHPPCTHLATSGARWFGEKVQEQAEALELVKSLLASPFNILL